MKANPDLFLFLSKQSSNDHKVAALTILVQIRSISSILIFFAMPNSVKVHLLATAVVIDDAAIAATRLLASSVAANAAEIAWSADVDFFNEKMCF
ncbi:unnamed protein product [Absidia cylindrospora]